jgi:hypothetical protein
MDRLYGYYTVHINTLNEHAAKMPARYGGSEETWRLKVLSRTEFEANLKNQPRNPEVKVAWICRMLSNADKAEQRRILDGIRRSLDTGSATLLEKKVRQAA